jgi:hypothetical protein
LHLLKPQPTLSTHTLAPDSLRPDLCHAPLFISAGNFFGGGSGPLRMASCAKRSSAAIIDASPPPNAPLSAAASVKGSFESCAAAFTEAGAEDEEVDEGEGEAVVEVATAAVGAAAAAEGAAAGLAAEAGEAGAASAVVAA